MAEHRSELLDALRAHLDLDEPPEPVERAWQSARPEERKALLDRLLLEALLVDTLAGSGAAAAPAARRRLGRRGWLVAAAALVAAVGVGLYLAWPRQGYPRPAATGDFGLWSAAGQQVEREAPLRGDRLTAGPGGATLSLGGYCELALDPGTVVVLGGSPRQEQIEMEEGRLLCRLTPGRGEFTLNVPGGALEVVGTKFEVTVAYPVSQGGNAMRRSKKSVLVSVVVVTGLVGYHFGDLAGELSGGTSRLFCAAAEGAEEGAKRIVAGKPTLYPRKHPAWAEKGRIVGITRHCPGCKVEALDAKGNVVKSFAVAPGGGSHELQWLIPGVYALRVTADGYDTLVVKGLEVRAKHDLRVDIEFTDDDGGPKKIEAGKPRRLPRNHEAWRERGRVVGKVRDCPGCKVEALDAAGKVVGSFAVPAGGRSYELQWLAPGTYTLRVTADGYGPLTVAGLAVEAKSDLRVDIEFER